ncbi:MAG: transglycosylase SLT domain-containing protein [Candidatus Cloacimonadales bacterium]
MSKNKLIIFIVLLSFFVINACSLNLLSKMNNEEIEQPIESFLNVDSLYNVIESQTLTIFELQTTLDSILSAVDSLKQNELEIENYHIINKEFNFPDVYEFAGVSFDLKNERIRNKLEIIYNYEVKKASVFIPRSACYFPLFETYFEQYDIPDDVKYLAVAESNLSYMAYSSVGAAGLWQFMPGTAKMYQLKIDNYSDERRNVFKSTEAACKYLRDNYKTLQNRGIDDWLLAMAGYNAGIGNILKTMNEQGAQDFFSLIMRHDETNNYIWRAIAIKMIFEYEEQIFGKRFDREEYLLAKAKLVDIELNGYHNINNWAIAQGTNLSTIWELNPWIKINKRNQGKYSKINQILLPPGKYQILLPHDAQADSVALVNVEKTLLSKTSTAYSVDGVNHKIQKGETLSGIAKKYGVTVSQLKQWNNLSSNTIITGRNLIISNQSNNRKYIVKDGDNLYNISKKLGISVQHLMTKNNLKNTTVNGKQIILLKKGQTLVY